MKLFQKFFSTTRKIKRKTLSDYKREMLIRQGGEQFKKLVKKGLSVPVVLL